MIATATNIESLVNDYSYLIEATPDTKLCDLCKRFLEEKIFEKHSTSETYITKAGEKVKWNLCGLNVN